MSDTDLDNIDLLFCFINMVEIGGKKYPVEIVLVAEDTSTWARWSTKISPAEGWPAKEILEASSIDLSDARSVKEAAQETWGRILRTQMCCVHSVKCEHISDLLDRLLTAAGPDFPPKIGDSKDQIQRALTVSTLSEWPTSEVFQLTFSVADTE